MYGGDANPDGEQPLHQQKSSRHLRWRSAQQASTLRLKQPKELGVDSQANPANQHPN